MLVALKESTTPEFAPYLDLVTSLVQITAWSMNAESIDFMKNNTKTGGGKRNRKKNKNEGAKIPIEQ